MIRERGGGSLVDSAPSVRRAAGSRHTGTLGKSFSRSCTWRFGV